MAKKKDFDNVVEESFNEGYTSEPGGVENRQALEDSVETFDDVKKDSEQLSENEILLRKIIAGDTEVLNEIWGREDRSTYYLTDMHRACIDIMAHEEGIKKQQIVGDALTAYFSESTKEAAKERLVTLAIKNLERKIEKEKSNK